MASIPIVEPRVEEYLDTLLPSETDPILDEMDKEAHRRDFPHVGPHVGQLLFILARSTGARRVLELGSGFGYSAYWFAKGMGEGGEIHCTDLSPDSKEQAQEYFRRAGMASRLHFHVGDSLSVAKEPKGPFDIVFNDIDKEDYPKTIDFAYQRLGPGGLFITDNTLWYGRPALNPNLDEATRAVVEFNAKLRDDPRWTVSTLPLRDGVTVCVKL